MKKYQNLFFDLDHTLWDFEKNAKDAIQTMYARFELAAKGCDDFEIYFENFSIINKNLWKLLDAKQITHLDLRTRRFKEAAEASNLYIDESLSLAMNEAFLELLPLGKNLIEGTMETLEALSNNYTLHLLTNGYLAVQEQKVKSSGIAHFFKTIAANDNANALKPDEKIFRFAIEQANTNFAESLMIGDNYDSDVLGAINVGMDVVYYNPDNDEFSTQPTYEIKQISQLLSIL
jgi:YjjG family noncanonical pyrimidine nucleotidase